MAGRSHLLWSDDASIDIGRDQHLDWTLPDPTRYISGKHCEIHYRDNALLAGRASRQMGRFCTVRINAFAVRMSLRTGTAWSSGNILLPLQSTPKASVPVAREGHSAIKRAASICSSMRHIRENCGTADRAAPAPVDRSQMLRSTGSLSTDKSPDFLDWAAAVPEVECQIYPSANARGQAPAQPDTGMTIGRTAGYRPNAEVTGTRATCWPRRAGRFGKNDDRTVHRAWPITV